MKTTLIFTILFTCIISSGNAQILKDKKNTYKELNCYIERIDAENFNYEDKDIKFFIRPSFQWWTIRIENKTEKDMIILWDKAILVFDRQSGSFMIVTDNFKYIPILFSDENIAPYSYVEKDYTSSTLRGKFIIDDRRIKKTGLDYYIELILPIEVNGEIKTYNFKYKVSLVNQKKQKKALEKRMKKILKEKDQQS